MATSFSGITQKIFDLTYSKTFDLGNQTGGPRFSRSQAWTNGSGSGQGNTVFHDTRTLASSTAETIDLTSTLSDDFGTTILFTKVKEIWIRNNNTTTAQVMTVSGNAMGAFLGTTTHTQEIGPTGEWGVSSPVDGMTITNTSQDQLTLTPGAYEVIYEIVIIGVV